MLTRFSKYQTLEDILPDLETEDLLVYPICDNIIAIARKCLDPNENNYVAFNQNLATIVGMFHKQVLLFSELFSSYKEGKMHIYMIFQRVIYEAYIKMLYLINHGEEAQKEYRLFSYKARKNFYDEHLKKNNGYLSVRNNKFLYDLADDGFKLDDFTKPYKSFGGKKFNQLMEEFEGKGLYLSLYGIPSDSIHSDWGDIRQLYLKKTSDKEYVAELDYMPSGHYRCLIPMADLLIDSCKNFINWEQGVEINKVYLPMLDELKRVCSLIMKSVDNDYQNNPEKFMYE